MLLLTDDPAKLREMLAWPAEDLGKFLLGLYFVAEAQARGIEVSDVSAIPEEFTESVRQALLRAETDRVDVVPLEKALHLAASEDFARAGNLFRQYMQDGALRLKLQELAAAGLPVVKGRREGGRVTAEIKRQKGLATTNRVRAEYDRLKKAGRSDPDLTSAIARVTGVTPQQVNRIRKKLNLR